SPFPVGQSAEQSSGGSLCSPSWGTRPAELVSVLDTTAETERGPADAQRAGGVGKESSGNGNSCSPRLRSQLSCG
uniref:Uncharacterized protein n=1 Tax=Nothoprocta perdicaria TaxID=30464 RepID=A0A8C6YL87_NOTPE